MRNSALDGANQDGPASGLATACHAGDRGFNPVAPANPKPRPCAGVAQLVERRPEEPRVGGSIPSPGTTRNLKGDIYKANICKDPGLIQPRPKPPRYRTPAPSCSPLTALS